MTTVSNLFLLTADSLRADVLPGRTAALAEKIGGVDFTNACTTANATAHSMPALTAGIYRDSIEERFDEHVVTLAQHLTDAGYDCSLWADNKIIGPERGYDRAFRSETAGTGTGTWHNSGGSTSPSSDRSGSSNGHSGSTSIS